MEGFHICHVWLHNGWGEWTHTCIVDSYPECWCWDSCGFVGLVSSEDTQLLPDRTCISCCFQNLYDMLLNMLEERGITADFINELVDFSTAFEHRKYIGLLEDLKDFVSLAQ